MFKIKTNYLSFLVLALTLIYYCGVIGCSLYFVLAITEIIIMKVIYIYKFSMITSMNEYFVTTLLILFNIVLVGISVTNHLIVKEYETSNHAYLCHIQSQDPLNQLNVRKNAQDTAVRLV